MGKYVLACLNHIDAGQRLLKQVHGRIVRADPGEGTFIALSDGTGEFGLPPDTSAFSPAKPGHYRLRSTGEVVVNADLIARWVVHAPPD